MLNFKDEGVKTRLSGIAGRFLLAQLLHTVFTLGILAILFIGVRQVGALDGMLAPVTQITTSSLATTINFQGHLANTSGDPLDGTYDLKFAVYDALTDGAMVWPASGTPELHEDVAVSDGLFSVGLGSCTDGGIPTSVWSGDRYLQVWVESEELAPRELLRSVPVSQIALTVPDGAIGSRQLSPSWYGSHNLQKVSTTSTTDLIDTGTSVTFTCETDCTALILHRSLVQHSVENGRVDIRVMVDDDLVFGELGVVNKPSSSGAGQDTFANVSGFDFVNLPAGTHIAKVLFKCDVAGPCYYYGDDDEGNWEHLNVLVFAQP